MRNRSTLPAALAGLALLSTTGCGADDPKQEAAEPPSAASTSSDPQATASTSGAHPDFTASDYRYVLVRSCYCPFNAPVEVTVRDGDVTSAVARQSAGRTRQGDPAPDTHRLTIGDIIDIAEDPSQNATVRWPDDQAWPDRVRTDPVAGARDDEVTYTIKRVRVR